MTLLPAVARVVKPEAVELDGEAVAGPAAVHALGARTLVRLWKRKASGAQVGQEGALEVAQSDGLVPAKDPPQVCGSPTARSACQNRLDLPGCGPMQHARLVTGPREGPLAEQRRQVHQRARHAGHRDTQAEAGICAGEAVAAPRRHARHPSLRRGNDRRHGRGSFHQPPQVRGRGVAEQRVRTAGQHGREEPCLPVRRRVAHSENAAVYDDQCSLRRAPVDRRGRDARSAQLPACDQPVLPGRYPGDCLLRRPDFASHTGAKSARRRISPPQSGRLTRQSTSAIQSPPPSVAPLRTAPLLQQP